MVKKKKIKDLGFCIMPGLVGATIILFSISAAFSDEGGVFKNFSIAFFWIFLGIVLISHTAISYNSLCKCE